MNGSLPDHDDATVGAPHAKAVGASLAVGVVAALVFFGPWFSYHVASVKDRSPVAIKFAVVSGIAAIAVLVAWLFTPMHAGIVRLLDFIRAPSRRSRRAASLAVALASAAYIYGTAVAHQRSLMPLWHDSNQHMVQAQLLLHGRLWAAPHALAEQMETFFVLTTPVYAAIHFPGTSMLYAPLLALGMPPAVFSALMTGAIIGLMYRITCELLDGVAAALAVSYLLGLSVVRELGVLMLSHHMFLVPTLLAFWAYLRWRRAGDRSVAWAIAIGCFVSYAGIMRPVEALAYGAAIGLAMLLERRARGVREALATVALLVLGGLPWVGLQLAFNYNVTGHVLRPPYEEYVQRYHPRTSYGQYGDDAMLTPIVSNLPQKADYYSGLLKPLLEQYEFDGSLYMLLTERLPMSVSKVTPSPLTLLFWAPASLSVWRRWPARAMVIAAVFFWTFYLPHVFFLLHYSVALIPVGALLAVSGAHVVGRTFVGGKRSIAALASLSLFALSVVGLPEVNRVLPDDGTRWAAAGTYVSTRLPTEVQQPAVVLFRYRTWDQAFEPSLDMPEDEPVYTIDALWPEESSIARFHDLGPAKNREIYAFFAARKPERMFYLLDRRSRRLLQLGTAAALLAAGEPAAYFDYVSAPKEIGQ